MAARWGRWLSGLMLAVVVGAGAAPVQGGEEHLLYLPLARWDVAIPGLWGYVTDAGAPASGAALELYREPPGGLWIYAASATVQGDGLYVFDGLAALPAGDKYVVVYTNTTDSSRLRQAIGSRVETYAPGDSVHAADFDLANVPLVSPGDGAAVWPPVSLTWVKRSASPDDHYMVAYYDQGGAPLLGTGWLGWYDSYYQFALPPTLSYNTPYQWTVNVLLPGGGFGLNFEMHKICFGSCPAAAANWRPDWLALLP